MKKYMIGLLLFIIISSQKAYAEVSNNISVTTNGSSANSSVSVTNNVNTDSSSTSTSHTDIYMNTNGNVQEYHSDKPGSVTLHSENGTNTVTVNNSQNQEASQSSQPNQKNKDATQSAKANNVHLSALEKTQLSSFITFLQRQIESLKNFFAQFKF